MCSTPTPADDPLLVVPRPLECDLEANARVARGDAVPADALSSAVQKFGAHSRAEPVEVPEDKGWL